jgi:hypothetical protein
LLTSLGCQSKVVIVKNGDPVMLAEATQAKAYAFDKNGKMTGPFNIIIPAGWYALPKN